ncbi:MAG: extracellular solute-binding protein [Burkholderiaceae bacterium]
MNRIFSRDVPRRTLLQALAAAGCMLLLGAAPVPSAAQGADAFGDELYAKAKAAGEKRVSYYTSMVPAQFQALSAAWKQRYPEIEIQLVRADLGQTLERVMAENRARRNIADVISSNEASFAVLHKAQMLTQFDVPSRQNWAEPFKSGFNGFQFPSRILQIGIAYNTSKVKAGDAPRTWKDLTDKRWKGRIGIADPRVGGGAQLWFMSLWDRPGYGADFFRALQQNEPLVKPGIVQLQQAVELGEVDINVVAYDYVALPARDAGKPVDFVMPSDGRIIMATFDSVSRHAPNPNAARLLINFMMSQEGQEALAATYVSPVNQKAQLNPKGVKADGIPLFASGVSDEQVAKLKTYIDAINQSFQLR